MPQCVCTPCPEVFTPVCGSDGLTYPSMCHIEEASCMERTDITLAKEGVCGEWEREILVCLFVQLHYILVNSQIFEEFQMHIHEILMWLLIGVFFNSSNNEHVYYTTIVLNKQGI